MRIIMEDFRHRSRTWSNSDFDASDDDSISADEMRNNLLSQLNEIDLLQNVYCEDGEFELITANARSYIEELTRSDTPVKTLSPIQMCVQLNCSCSGCFDEDEEKPIQAKVNISMKSTYPSHSRPGVYVCIPNADGRSREDCHTIQTYLNSELQRWIIQWRKRDHEACLLKVLHWIEENTMPLIENGSALGGFESTKSLPTSNVSINLEDSDSDDLEGHFKSKLSLNERRISSHSAPGTPQPSNPSFPYTDAFQRNISLDSTLSPEAYDFSLLRKVTKSPQCRVSGPDTDVRPLFERLWIYSHHIYAKSKREFLLSTTRSLGLTGFALAGKPGIICVEGLSENCRLFWEQCRKLSWQKITLRLEEQISISDTANIDSYRKFGKFAEFSATDQCSSNHKNVKKASNMKQFIEWLKQVNCEEAAAIVLGMEFSDND